MRSLCGAGEHLAGFFGGRKRRELLIPLKVLEAEYGG